MQFPILEIPPAAASGLLSALSFVFAVLTGLVTGGAVFMLVAQKRGAGSIEPRWDDLARQIATWVLNLTLSGVAVAGVSLWMVFIFIHPQAAAHLQNIFFWPLLAGWVFLTCGVALLAVYAYGWDRWRYRFREHFVIGAAAAVCLWLAAAFMVSIKSFTLTSGEWSASAPLASAVFNPSLIPAYLLWTAVSLILAGSAGLIFAMRQKDNLWRETIVHEVGTFTAVAALAGSVACLAWLIVLSFAGNLDGMEGEIPPVYFGAGVAVIAVELSILLVLTAVRRPKRFGNVLCAVAVVSVITLVAGVQAVQDKSQGPFLIQNYMYRNGILVSEVERLKQEGFWKPVAWRGEKENSPQNGALGAYNFRAQCRVCHAGWQKAGLSTGMPSFKFEGDALRFLDQISSRHPFFPVFAGSGQEKQAVALYLEGLLKKSGISLASRPVVVPQPAVKKTRKKSVKAKKNIPPAAPLPVAPQIEVVPQTEKPAGDETKATSVPEENTPSSGEARSSGEVPQGKSVSPPEEAVKAAPESSDGVLPQPPVPPVGENAKAAKPEIEKSPPPSGGEQTQKSDANPAGHPPGAAADAPHPADPVPVAPEIKKESSEIGAGGEKR